MSPKFSRRFQRRGRPASRSYRGGVGAPDSTCSSPVRHRNEHPSEVPCGVSYGIPSVDRARPAPRRTWRRGSTPMTTHRTPASAPNAWWAPRAEKVAEGVHRIPLPLPNSVVAVNVYALETGAGLVLVDSGWSPHPGVRKRLADALATLGAGLADVCRFLVTHAHRDHYTYAVEHRAEFGSRVAIGAGEAVSLAELREQPTRPHAHDLARLHRGGADNLARRLDVQVLDTDLWADPDEWLQPGPVGDLGSHRLEAVATPGHTRGHLVFLDEQREAAYTGDRVLPLTVPSAGSDPSPTRSAVGAQLASLRVLLSRADLLVLPAHGPVGARTHERAG